jgi:TonB-linked SusC/RagA family outer membrane protein
MRRLLFLVLGMLLISAQILAQNNRTITGNVTDDNGQPVSGASVIIKNTRTGTSTDAKGSFTISVAASAKAFVISAVGFVSQEISIGTETTLTITLKQDASTMEQVVITGYTREKRTQFSGSATVIAGDKVASVPVGSFDQALQGRAAGVLVNSGSGQPGSSPTIIIRGVQSIQGAGAQPLFIIDGVPMPAADMQTINPNDFESITVLKDAGASALYGARGGTGVIVITTKRGKAGVSNLTLRTQFGMTQKPSFSQLNMMNTSEILRYEEMTGLAGAGTNTPGWVYSLKNPANASLPATSPAGNPFAPSQARYTAILDSVRGIDMDYTDLFFRQGISQSHQFDMNGGNDKTRFYLSGSYFGQQGVAHGSDLNRYTTRFNIDHTSGKLSVSMSSLVGYSKTNFSEGEWLGNSPRNPFQMVYRAKPYENPYKTNGSLNYGASTSLNLKQIANLIEGVNASTYRDNQIKINSGLTIAYKLFSWLTLKNTVGVDVSSNLWQHTIQAGSYYGTVSPTFNSGEDRETYQLITQVINTSALLFNKRFADVHEVELGAYFEAVRGKQKGLGFTLYNLDPRLSETGQGAGALPVSSGQTTYPQNASSAKSGYGIRSYFATGRYTYNGKYTLNANIRRDGTSRIVNVNNREITTWSAGVIWNAIKESFLKQQSIFSDLRLRVSYGIVPNIGSISTGTYGIGGGIISLTNYQGTQVPAFGTTTYAGSAITGLAPTNPGNPNLKIEMIKKANIGVDFAMWQNRARVSFDVYKNNTALRLFVNQPLSATTGFGNQSLAINAGTMSNKGFEGLINVDVVKQKDLVVTLGINHSMNINKIEDLGLVNEYFLGTFVIRKGLPYGSHYTYNYLGADPTTGKPIFETADGKTTNDIGQAGQFAKFGTYLPKHEGGFTADITFKRFSVSALFSYQFDVVRSDNTRNWITRGVPGYYAAVNQSREMLTNQWMKAGDNKFFQSPLYDRGFTSSDLHDAKFLRFRNLMLAYSLPQISIGGTTVMKSGRFYVQGQNIAVWSPWKGLDIEDNNNISLNEYPNPKMVVVGLDINL